MLGGPEAILAEQRGHPLAFPRLLRSDWCMEEKSRIPPGITREHVLAAVIDYNAGVQHGFGPSTKYDLLHEGQRLPPKAIVGLAAKHATGHLLTPKDFKGGEESTCFRVLRELDFTVELKASLDWTETECFFAVWGYDQLDLDRSAVKKILYRELDELLSRTEKSVEFKIQNVSSCDPRPRAEKPISEAPHKQALLQRVFNDYWADRVAARAREPELRELLKFPDAQIGGLRKGSTHVIIEEGSVSSTTTRTRSRQLVEQGRKHFRAQDPEGKLRCRACGFVTPGQIVNDREIVQLHHTRPLADVDEGGHSLSLEEALQHMLPLCPNCHALAHTAKPPLELPALIDLARNSNATR